MVKINNFDLKLSEKFTEINLKLKNGGYEFEKFIKMLEDWKFTKCNQIIKKMIKKDILKPFHFINNIDPFINDELLMKNNVLHDPQTMLVDNKLVINSDIKLNSVGVTKILQFPNSTDIWDKCDEITEAYSKFMDNYFLMIEDLLDNSTEELNLIYDEHNSVYDFIKAYTKVFEFGLENLSDICEEYSSFTHNQILPILIKDEKSIIDFKDLKKKLNNNMLFDHFLKHTESKRVLYGWKYISESALNDIIENYRNDKKSDIVNDSDEEEI